MSRNRTVKPEFFLDERLTSLSFNARLLFLGMWCCASDDDSLPEDHAKIRADVCPFEHYDIAEALAGLESTGLIRRASGVIYFNKSARELVGRGPV